MLEKESLWQTAALCHAALATAALPHAVVGGVAVCLHGYQRNTLDLDLLVRRADGTAVAAALTADHFTWHAAEAEFRSPAGIAVQLLLAGDRAGKGSEVLLPDPGDPRCVTEIEGLPVLTLARLIESKLACGQGNLRRTHKDFADVLELIVHHGLSGAFARHLHKSVRPAYRQLVRSSRGEA